MLKIGGIRYDSHKPVKLLTQKKNQQIYSQLKANSLDFDTYKDISGKTVNNFLKGLKDTIGISVKEQPVDKSYKYLQAHGAFQILDDTGKEVVTHVEKLSRPFKTLFKSLMK